MRASRDKGRSPRNDHKNYAIVIWTQTAPDADAIYDRQQRKRRTEGQKETPSREGVDMFRCICRHALCPRAHTRTQSAYARSYTPVDRMETYTGVGIGGCFSVWRGGL